MLKRFFRSLSSTFSSSADDHQDIGEKGDNLEAYQQTRVIFDEVHLLSENTRVSRNRIVDNKENEIPPSQTYDTPSTPTSRVRVVGRRMNLTLIQPNDRLRIFRELCSYLHDLFFVYPLRPNLFVEHTELPRCLDDFTRILVEEERFFGCEKIGVCLEYALSNKVFYELGEAGGHDRPIGATREILRTFTTLTTSLDVGFLRDSQVYRSFMGLIETCVNDTALSVKMGQPVVELLVALCVQLKHHPDLLNCFFYGEKESIPISELTDIDNSKNHQIQPKFSATDHVHTDNSIRIQQISLDEVSNAIPEDENLPQQDGMHSRPIISDCEFPLFRYCLYFAERQGTVGELAKTGLICCIDVSTEVMSQYVVERSEFCNVLIGGLCTMYQQLPKTSPTDDQLMAQNIHVNAIFVGIASYLEFYQSIIRKADPLISTAILTNFNGRFLEQCLRRDLVSPHPSLNIILGYINDMLLILSEENLSRLVIDFLLSWNPTRSFVTPIEEPPIIEVLLGALRSDNQSSKLGVLRLLFVIISSHYPVAFLHVHRLICQRNWLKLEIIKTPENVLNGFSLDPPSELRRFYNFLDTGKKVLIASELEAYITDAEQIISFRLEKLVLSCNRLWEIKIKSFPSVIHPHEHDFALLDILINEMDKYMENDLETNLVLTGVLSQIAMCPDPLCYELLYNRDLHLDKTSDDVFGKNFGRTSLYTCLHVIRNRYIELTRNIPEFHKELERARESLNHTRQLDTADTDDSAIVDAMLLDDSEIQWRSRLARRIAWLEEFIKEMLAILQIHLLQVYHHQTSYDTVEDRDSCMSSS